MPLDRSRWAPVPEPWPGSARLGLPDPPRAAPATAPAVSPPPRTASPGSPAPAPTKARPKVRVQVPEHIARHARDVVEGRAPIGSRAPTAAPHRPGAPS